MTGGSPLRVAAMLDVTLVPAWTAWLLTAIRERRDLALALVIQAEPLRDRRGAVLRLYEMLDRRLFPAEPDAFAPVDVSATLAGVPRAGSREAGAHDLDVILHLGGERPRGPELTAARHGVWSYRFGAGTPPALFWELARAQPYAETALDLLEPDGGSRPIYRSVGSVDAVSLNRNGVPAHWKSARFALRRLEDLAAGRWQPGARDDVPAPPGAAAPSNADALRHMAAIGGRIARRKLHLAVYQHQWFLGLRRRDGDRLPQDDPAPWRPVLPPSDRSYADPFVVRHGGETYVFLEVLPHDSGVGELAVGRLTADGALADLEPILPVPHHTSYPFVFRDGDATFLIPESGDAGRVELLAATDFPVGWERVATLLDGVNAVDATVHAHGGLYWMWVTTAVPGGRLNDETFLYFSDRLDGGWAPHPRNPVVSDARRARSAGRPFVHDGVLIRPSQDCSARYGRRVVFNAVELLTPDEYRERPVGTLGPEWSPLRSLAAHTYTFDGEWEATDGLRTFPRLLSRGRP